MAGDDDDDDDDCYYYDEEREGERRVPRMQARQKRKN